MPDKVDLSKVSITKLSKIYDLSQFDCGDSDLNDFIKNDAFKYEEQRLASTYLVIYGERISGFFSLVNDGIRLLPDEKDKEHISKFLPEYPALKIGRLGVQKDLQKCGFGSLMVKTAIALALECRHGAGSVLNL